jgi:hypothetical protein
VVAVAAGVVVLIAVAVLAVTRPTSSYAAGSVKEPAEPGEAFRDKDGDGTPWRGGAVDTVAEVPTSAGTSNGRCFVAVGWVETTREGFAAFSSEERALTVSYAVDGEILATGDATAACDAQAIEDAAAARNYETLERILDREAPLPQFVTVTYVTSDAEPDTVVLSTPVADEGGAIPRGASVYLFRTDDSMWLGFPLPAS